MHHIGSDLSFGHYKAECKIGSKWYVFDDEKVSPIESPGIKSSTAYVLFYKQEQEEGVINNLIF